MASNSTPKQKQRKQIYPWDALHPRHPQLLEISRSTLLTFDDLSPGTDTLLIPNGYGGLTWSNFYAYNGTLAQPAYGYFKGIVSTANVALNGFADPSGFSSSSLIDLNSAYMTAAFDYGLQVR